MNTEVHLPFLIILSIKYFFIYIYLRNLTLFFEKYPSIMVSFVNISSNTIQKAILSNLKKGSLKIIPERKYVKKGKKSKILSIPNIEKI